MKQSILESIEQAVAQGWYPARRELLSRLAAAPETELAVWVPEADVEENAREIVVSMALPGVEKADIRVETTEDSLTVGGVRKDPRAEGRHVRRERPTGRFLRRVRLPAAIKPTEAHAAYRNGVLTVTLPRVKTSFGRSVKVD